MAHQRARTEAGGLLGSVHVPVRAGSCQDTGLSFSRVAFRGSSVILRSFRANVHTNSSFELPVSSPSTVCFCTFCSWWLCVIGSVGFCGRSWVSPMQVGVSVSCKIGRPTDNITGLSPLVGQGGKKMMMASWARQPPMECSLVARPVWACYVLT